MGNVLGAINRSTLAEQAYSDLRARIVSGRLSAGQRLLPEELAVSMAISPTPIKAALVRLEQDGLVAMQTRRGAIVRRFTPEEVRDLYDARGFIELHALDRGFSQKRVSDDFIQQLRDVHSGLLAGRALATQEGLTEALSHDRAFHALIVSLAKNRTLADCHTRVLMQTHTMRIYSLDSYPLKRLDDEHTAIMAAFSKRSAKQTRAALQHHLLLSRDELLSRLSDTAG